MKVYRNNLLIVENQSISKPDIPIKKRKTQNENCFFLSNGDFHGAQNLLLFWGFFRYKKRWKGK